MHEQYYTGSDVHKESLAIAHALDVAREDATTALAMVGAHRRARAAQASQKSSA